MTAILSAAVIFVVFAAGDMISAKTKAIVSMLLVASVVFLAGFWTNIFPSTLFADSTLLSMAGLLVTMLLVHLGTTIKLRDFGAQWRTVIISALACVAISVAVYFLGQLIVDRGFALVGAPILSGGVVATLQMTEMANNASRPELAVFATLVMCAQGFVGYPVASLCLKSEAKRLKRDIDAGSVTLVPVNAAQAAARKKLIPALPAKYNTPNTIIAKVILVALLSTWVSSLFHDAVNKLVWCLIFGVLCKEIGFLDEDALGKAHATGIVMPIITLSIFGSSCLFGFPGTVIISNEVSESTGTTEEEKAYISAQIMPKMLVAGMVTVSITSVLVAGVMCKWL